MQATPAEPVFDDIAIRGTVARPIEGHQIFFVGSFHGNKYLRLSKYSEIGYPSDHL